MSSNKGRIRDGSFISSDDLEKYLKERASMHHHYRYYSKREYIESICKSNCLYISDGSNWNDKEDRQSFQDDGAYRRFGICFSYSVSENVAMWMLYSGTNGNMIDFDRKSINLLCDEKSVDLGYFEDGNYKKVKELSVSNNEYKISMIDMVYYDESTLTPNNDIVYVRRSDETNKEFKKSIVGRKYYSKKLPWSFENECRLIVSVLKEAIEPFHEGYFIRLAFPESVIRDLQKNSRIKNSPNTSEGFRDAFYWGASDSTLYGIKAG